MPKINVLPRQVAELIAAGEVIERPSSIVKELVENAIDAGSTTITVEIQHGGVRYLRVTDNGCGIEREDAPKAFLRHATSKVKGAADLDAIGTLGFRGEALASIAAVAHVEMMTKVKESVSGTLVKVSGSEVTEVSDAGCPDGTTIVVRDVFYNVPARLKFLKKDTTESGAVASIVDKIALSHPEISFSFIRDGKQIYRTPGNGDLMGAIYTVLGREFAKGMLPVDYTSGGVTVKGYISRPTASRANRSMQHFFVNGRYTRTRTCGVALEEGFRGALMVGKFPSCVLMLTMPCEMVDVNVHPAKIEVRFQSEKTVFDAVYFAVKSTLMQDGSLQPKAASHAEAPVTSPFADRTQAEQTTLPTGGFSTMTAQEFKARFQKTEEKPRETAGAKVQLREEWLPPKNREVSLDVEPDPEDFADLPQRVTEKEKREAVRQEELKKRLAEKPPVQPSTDGVEKVAAPVAYRVASSLDTDLDVDFEDEPEEVPLPVRPAEEKVSAKPAPAVRPSEEKAPARPAPQAVSEPSAPPAPQPAPPAVTVFGEVFSTYILCQIGEEFVLIDKHAAHERIRYNRLKSEGEVLSRQLLLAPVTLNLSREDHQLALEQGEALKKLGFEAEDFGGNTIILRSVPAVMADASPAELFQDALEGLSRSHAGLPAVDDILHRMACRSAVKGGDHNTRQELEALARRVASDEEVRFCPHGRPVMIRFTKRQLEKMFGRIQ